MSKNIEHKGIVKSVSSDRVKVMVIAQSACASCHAKGSCSMADMEEKEIDVNPSGVDYKTGENVMVVLSQSQGFRALFWGYIVPLLVVLTTLIVATSLEISEGQAGLSAILMLIPYYFGLWLFKSRIKSQFNFSVKKLNK